MVLDFDNNVISILMYADDIVLISESTVELQIMLNSLNSWCCKWRQSINESKTKVIHFRNKNTLRTDYVFNCGENTNVCVSEYPTDLGFWFNEHLDMEKSVTDVTKADGRALGAVYMKYSSAVCPRGGRGGTLIFPHIRRLRLFFGLKILNFNIFGGFEKKKRSFFGGMKILWIFLGGNHKTGLI